MVAVSPLNCILTAILALKHPTNTKSVYVEGILDNVTEDAVDASVVLLIKV